MEVPIKTRSTPASLSFKGQATKLTTVKCAILGFHSRDEMAMLVYKKMGKCR